MAHAGGPPSAAVASAAAVIALCVLDAAAVKRRERGNGALPSWVLRAGGEDAGGGLAERHATVGTEAARRSVPALEELQLGVGEEEEESVKDAMLAAFKAGDLAVHMFHPTRALEKLKSVHDKGRFDEALSTSQIRPEYAGFETYDAGIRNMGWLLHLPSCRVHLASSADLFVTNKNVVGERRHWYLTLMLKESPHPMHSVLGTEHGPAMRHLVYDPNEEAWARTLCDEPMEGAPLRCYNSSDAGAFEAIKKAMLAEVRPVIKSHEYTGNPRHRREWKGHWSHAGRSYWTEVVAACPLGALVGIVVLEGVSGDSFADTVGELLGTRLMVAEYVPYREGVNQTGGRTEEAALDFRRWTKAPRPWSEYKDEDEYEQYHDDLSTGTGNIDQNQKMKFDSPLLSRPMSIGLN